MVALLLLVLLQTAPAPAQPPPAQAPKPRPATSAGAANVSLMLFVTDGAGRNLEDVTVTLMGPVDREMKTPGGTGLRVPNLRAGTYRARFARDGFYTFEKEIVVRAGTSPEIAVTLNAAPPPPPPPTPPPAPAPPPQTAAPALPPTGTPKTLSLPDYIEKNFISGREGHKENIVGCSGVGQAVLWQVRDPWEGRQHTSADGMLYVIGGEGTIRIDGRDIVVSAGSFAVVPRGTMYGFTRRGRNPLIVLAVLAGAPCAAD